MQKNYAEKIDNFIGELYEKQKALEDVKEILDNIQNYVYRKKTVEDEEGNYVKDENGFYVYENYDCNYNKILDTVCEWIIKTYTK